MGNNKCDESEEGDEATWSLEQSDKKLTLVYASIFTITFDVKQLDDDYLTLSYTTLDGVEQISYFVKQ